MFRFFHRPSSGSSLTSYKVTIQYTSRSSFAVIWQKRQKSVVPHPPYSPDLAPADFFLFPTLTTTLKGHRFQTIEEMSLIRGTACPCAQFSRCCPMTNSHSETGQMAVCCQNLMLGALSSCSLPSVLVGALFKKFGLFLNRPRI
jgi:hypothetical protein